MNAQSWACPDEVTAALCRSRLVRLVLATPALFTNGWYPGWLSAEDGYRTGRPPGADETVQLRLISACIGRYEPLSGWNMERVNNKEKGAKPLRRMVPAGSVYYFEYIGEGDPKTLANLWLMSVCDNEPDRLDGFGLALWGIWEYGTDVDGVV
jgi:CRISPR-associated protein Cmr3